MRPCFAALILGLSLSPGSFAEAIPQKVDLRDQFGPPRKQVGATCHIYAAVALVEAACYRLLGKHLDISEAYLAYRHLRDVPESRLQKRTAPGGVHYFESENPPVPSNVELGPLAGGNAVTTLSRVLSEGACLESEIKEDPLEFFRFLQYAYDSSQNETGEGSGASPVVFGGLGALTGSSAGVLGIPAAMVCKSHFAKLAAPLLSIAGALPGAFGGYLLGRKIGQKTQDRQACRDAFCEKIDEHVKKVAAPQVMSTGLVRKTEDPDLEKCLRSLSPQPSYATTHENMKTLLSQGYPFALGGDWYIYSRNDDGNYQRQGPYGHEVAVIGYKQDPKAKDGVYYLVRNSWGQDPEWVEIDEGTGRMDVLW